MRQVNKLNGQHTVVSRLNACFSFIMNWLASWFLSVYGEYSILRISVVTLTALRPAIAMQWNGYVEFQPQAPTVPPARGLRSALCFPSAAEPRGKCWVCCIFELNNKLYDYCLCEFPCDVFDDMCRIGRRSFRCFVWRKSIYFWPRWARKIILTFSFPLTLTLTSWIRIRIYNYTTKWWASPSIGLTSPKI